MRKVAETIKIKRRNHNIAVRDHLVGKSGKQTADPATDPSQ